MKHSTIHELAGDVKYKIAELESIVDVILAGYRTAADVLDSNIDHRTKYIEQLQELNELLGSIVNTHPAAGAEKIYQNNFRQIGEIFEFTG